MSNSYILYPLKADVKLCCILQVSTVFCSTLVALMMAVSSPHHWRMRTLLSVNSSILWKQRKNSIGQFLHTLLLMAHVNVCCILQVSTIYCSTLAAIMMVVSFCHHCHTNDACKCVLHFASFYNILFNFGSHNDGGKLLSSLSHQAG